MLPDLGEDRQCERSLVARLGRLPSLDWSVGFLIPAGTESTSSFAQAMKKTGSIDKHIEANNFFLPLDTRAIVSVSLSISNGHHSNSLVYVLLPSQWVRGFLFDPYTNQAPRPVPCLLKSECPFRSLAPCQHKPRVFHAGDP